MIADILTVMGKEFKEILAMRGKQRGGLVSLLVVLGVFGILLPIQNGPGFMTSSLSSIYYGWIAYLMAAGVVADSFAGERERHTLETLLATRLSDSAILLGKLAATVLYGTGMALVAALAAMVTVSVTSGALVLYPPLVALGIVGGALLAGMFAAGLGVNISLRAASVRQAGQTMSVLMFVVLVPLMILPMLPQEWVMPVAMAFEGMDGQAAVMGGSVFALLLDLGLILVAIGRFKRARLILD